MSATASMARSHRSRGSDADESIYNLIPAPTVSASRSPLYRSKYPADTPPTASTFGTTRAAVAAPTNVAGAYTQTATAHRHKQQGADWGPKNKHMPDPTQFQTANSQPEMPQPSRFTYTTRTKPPLSTHHARDSPVVQARTEAMARTQRKNFISENALAVIMADARRPVRAEADYLKKEDYGKTPAYLANVKAEIAAEQDYIRSVLQARAEAERAHEPTTQLLPEEERLRLLAALKQKWEAVNKQYQTTTHMVTLDTQGKVRRKEQYEIELQQIEKSIEKLNKPYVFVQSY